MKDNTFSALVEAINKKFGHTYLEGVLQEPEDQETKDKTPLNAKAERKGG